MIVVDTGPLVSILDIRDADHIRCAAAISKLPNTELITTWPCFTEAMYLLHRQGGWQFQETLWAMRSSRALQLFTATDAEEFRMKQLMRKYADSPMDMADASLVAAAESLNSKRIFTLDRHFYAYRLLDGSPFDVIIV